MTHSMTGPIRIKDDLRDLERRYADIRYGRQDHLNTLFRFLLQRRPVQVLVPLLNGSDEEYHPAGWISLIREIRRPALPEHVAAYGHLEPVIAVDGGRGLTICLRPDHVRAVTCRCSEHDTGVPLPGDVT